MIKHTTDPAERAASIAERVADEVWKRTRNYREEEKTWFSVYSQALREFACPGEQLVNLKGD